MRGLQQRGGRSEPSAGKRVVLVFVGVGVAVLLFLGVRWQIGNADPEVTIPPIVAPTPNAFDFYCDAGQQLVDDKMANDMASSSPTKSYTLADRDTLVAHNATALQTMRKGFGYDYLDPSVRSISTRLPFFAQFRSLARIVKMEGQVKAGRGDWAGAVDSDLDAMRMGEDIPHGATIIGCLVGIACQAIGRRDIWAAIDHLDAAESRRAARRLEGIMAHHYPFANTLQQEKYFGQSALMEIFQKKQTLSSLGNEDGAAGSSNEAMFSSLLWMAYSKRRVMKGYTDYMDATAANARLPYASKPAEPPMPNDPINRVMLPVFAQAGIKDIVAETQSRLLLLSLALHAYHEEHRAYPQTLAQLAPAYLHKLPDDPFALKGSFRYRREGGKYVLYSIGPDGKDDGGAPIDNPTKSTATSRIARYYIYENSKGDIVAGTNIF